ncbi:MAG: FAD-dependent oxidoreductase [Proteobacteria bacterium]|nr:FAD-dependent oxidoreductase [Pseudomonadota bacterium]
MTAPQLAFGLAFEDLYARDGLVRLDRAFLAELNEADAALAARLLAARAEPDSLARKAESELLLALVPHVEDFLGRLFGIGREVAALAARHHELSPLYACKRRFVQRIALKAHGEAEAAAFDGEALARALEARLGGPLDEPAFARAVMAWLDDEAANAGALDEAARYAAWAVMGREGRRRHRRGVLFKVPRRVEPDRLVPVETEERAGVTMLRLPEARLRRREGFAVTDAGADLVHALDETHYCIFCHNQGKDSCSTGLKDKASGAFRSSAHGVLLAGCPLEEKISEMHVAKTEGHALGALALIAVDNPMVAATGHRICNDCMKSCIYQKQEPVNIPQAETRILKDVLALPCGFEVYGLLTRWNPLNLRRPLPAPASGRTVLVAGLGPAGFTLAHHLMNDGHRVIGIDGLKIEPLPAWLSGVDAEGRRVPFAPIRDVRALYESLDDRVMAGFGGVAEYGITVRWDKNFLKLVRLILERRREFSMFGGVRLGGALTLEQAFAEGIDHVALCLGAGRPSYVAMPNALAKGVRQASDFLMALQLTGAAKRDSVANLQLRLPVVVVGGGLTAIDTATEALAYYPVQVEKFLARYETLVAERGMDAVRAAWTGGEAEIADEFLAHARALRDERAAAAREGRPARVHELLRSWGGSTIVYRRRLQDSPSYRLNHEEVEKALEEGVRFAEGLAPKAVEVDAAGHAVGLRVERQRPGEGGALAPAGGEVVLPARAILIAAGTHPNTVLAREDSGHVIRDGRYFRAVDEEGNQAKPEPTPKPGAVRVLMDLREDGRAVSFFGDLHPSFYGNVVKAMASALKGYPVVSRMLARRPPAADPEGVAAAFGRGLRARIEAVRILAPAIVEVVVRAPWAARNFRPGQFLRLQNYEARSARVDGTLLAMEGLAMTGAWVDRERGLVAVIVLEMGGSSDLCALLKPGEPVVLMGPTGSPTEIPSGETVILVGGGLGNAVLFSIGGALRAAGSRVLYFAGYRRVADRYYPERIEAAADAVVWCCDEAPGFRPGRPQDRAFVGTIVDALAAYAGGRLGPPPIPLAEAGRMIVIGSDRMMAAVKAARGTLLAGHVRPGQRAIASINSPMQCMMKEICAQCLQSHRDPVTGVETVVFSCFNQDQPLDLVEFPVLAARLAQNAVQEKLTRQWIDRCLKRLEVRAAAS